MVGLKIVTAVISWLQLHCDFWNCYKFGWCNCSRIVIWKNLCHVNFAAAIVVCISYT